LVELLDGIEQSKNPAGECPEGVRMDSLTVETARFDYQEPKPHFINPNCFGEDFAAWLRERVAGFSAEGFEISEPIQEDYGWGFWLSRAKDTFWVAISFVDRVDDGAGAQWVVSVAYDPGLSILRRLFHKPDEAALTRVRNAIWDALRTAEGIRIVEEEQG
jgi:hypothetical protein